MSIEQFIPGSDPALIPSWLSRVAAIGVRLLLVFAAALVAIWFAALIWTTTVSVVVALIVSATFAPYVLWLRNRGWSRTAAALTVTALAVGVVILTVLLILVAFAPYVGDIASRVGDGIAIVQQQLAQVQVTPEVAAQLANINQQLKSWLTDQVTVIAGVIANIVTIAILGGLLTFFLLSDGDKAWEWGLQVTSDWRRDRILTAGHDALQRVGGYLRGTAVITASDAITDFVFLVVLGVPLAGPLAVLVFLAGFIPYVGGIFATVVLLIVTVAYQGVGPAVLLFVLISIVNVFQKNWLVPQVYGKTVHLHPAIVLLALPAGAAIGGVAGLFIAIPVVAFVAAVAESLIAVLGSDPGVVVEDESGVPRWLDRVAGWSWRLLIGLGVIAAGAIVATEMAAVVLPAGIALILATTFSPLLSVLLRRGWGRTRAALTVTIGVWAFVLVLTIISIGAFAGPAVEAIQTAIAGAQSAGSTDSQLAGWVGTLFNTFGIGIIAFTSDIIGGLAILSVILVLSGILSFYMLLDGDRAWATVTKRIPGWRRPLVDAAGRRSASILGGYMIATGGLALFNAITGYIIMIILGLPFALPIAVLSFFGGFIPYIGQFITTLLAFLVAVAVGSTQDIIVMGLYTVVMNIVQGSVLAPIVYGRAVSIHPAICLLAAPIGASLGGIVGMFLAVPIIGVIANTWRTVIIVFGDEEPADVEAARDERGILTAGAPAPSTPPA